ncbi:hypothetical protein [Streptacidiphilus cavernicola]|uniref:Uncharacterized protein n=1 Tax=Streptacidiphilus cavernicola TaxID=3342716 RepID=A0ABV6VY70_9ACTN
MSANQSVTDQDRKDWAATLFAAVGRAALLDARSRAAHAEACAAAVKGGPAAADAVAAGFQRAAALDRAALRYHRAARFCAHALTADQYTAHGLAHSAARHLAGAAQHEKDLNL